ncbi:hypothetical protein BDN71DRAFT_1593803 [Pleurotus eryngii]|uniref:Uncharacterized protein n=1 Tax=Pleurotus eryngii TaxID=5323 RepID=A0A9P5ZJC7_PLEER|nr:hypothetical protein BDN71DRAFT_1593803 [Pleurotus eryngii]
MPKAAEKENHPGESNHDAGYYIARKRRKRRSNVGTVKPRTVDFDTRNYGGIDFGPVALPGLTVLTKNAPVTQWQCNQEAERITGASANNCSRWDRLTLSSLETIVQFRDTASAVNLELLGYAEAAYPKFIPHHQHAGKLEDLDVYLMNKIGGISMYLAWEELYRNDFQLLHQTLRD